MEIGQIFATKNDCYKANVTAKDTRYSTFQKRGPLGVMVHSTGCNNPNLGRYVAPDDGIVGPNYYNTSWNNPGLDVAVHAFIGKDKNGSVRTYQVMPWNFRGWHCGDSGNNTHVSFEICEDDTNNYDYMRETYKVAVELTAHICKEYNLDPLKDGVVISHAEGCKRGIASNHGDPDHWWTKYGVTMHQFRKDVNNVMKGDMIDMTKNELQEIIDTAVAKVSGKRYNKLSDVKETYYKEPLKELISAGYLNGKGGDGEDLVIDMDENGVRALVIMYRAFKKANVL